MSWSIVLAGGVGERLVSADEGPRQAGRVLRRPVPHHRLRPQQLPQLGLRRIFIATQYKSLSLNRHIRQGWSIVSEELGEFIEILPPQKRVGEQWYQGTADAVYQNIYSIEREDAALRRHPGRRPHLQDGLPQDAAGAHRNAAPTSRWRRSKCRSKTASRFGIVAVDETRPRDRLPGEAGRARRRCPGCRTWRWPRWASTSSTSTCSVRALEEDAADADEPPRLRQEHHPGDDSGGGRCSPTRSTTRTRRRRSTGATSARSTPTTKPTWTCARSTRSSTSTTRSGRCAPISRSRRRPSSCSPRTAARARRSTR